MAPACETSQEWLDKSTLLFKAYPTTSRITTKYKISAPKSLKRKRTSPKTADPSANPDTNNTDMTAAQTQTSAPAEPRAPRATITLKTFDPVSGSCIIYRTDKEREVGRLISSLGRLGRHMAALPDADADVAEEREGARDETAGGGAGNGAGAGTGASATAVGGGAKADVPATSSGGGKKKKKGKR